MFVFDNQYAMFGHEFDRATITSPRFAVVSTLLNIG